MSSFLAPASYLILAAVLFSSAWADPRYLSIGEAGDSEIFMWMLGWVPYSITHGLNPLFTDFVVYPHGVSLLWELIPVFPGALLSPVMALFGPVVTYNLTVTLGLAGSAWCAYVAIKAFVPDTLAAWLGGLVYGFSPYMLSHALGHPNLVICMTPPLALLMLADLLVLQRRPSWLTGGALGVLGALQLLTAPEILFTTGIVGGIAVLVLALLNFKQIRQRLRHASAGLGIGLLVFAVLSAAPLIFMFTGPQQVHGVVREQDIYVTDLQNFVVPTKVMLLAPTYAIDLARHWTGDFAEDNAYLGLPLLALLGFITLRWWSVVLVRWSACVAAIVAVLSLGPHLHEAGRIHFHIPLPWLAVQHLPFFDNVLPSRLMLFVYLLAGLTLAFFVHETRRHRDRALVAGSSLWVAACIVFLLPSMPWPVTPNPVPDFFSGSGARQIPAGSVALVAPFSTAPGFQLGPGQNSATYPMLWQQASGMQFRMPEGGMNVPDVDGTPTGGRPPRSTTQTVMLAIQVGGPPPDLTPDLRDQIDADLRDWKVRTVIVGPMYNQAAMIRFFDDLLGREPQLEGGVYVWRDVQT